jgi:hypothetical protein
MWQNRFWLNMVGLCTVIACAFALALAVISASAALAFASHHDSHDSEVQPEARQDAGPQQRVFNGVVTDSSCRARHMAAGKSAAECTRECVGKGASYVLVAGEGVYRLDGNTSELDKVAGQRAQVIGLLDGRVLTVSSVTVAQ